MDIIARNDYKNRCLALAEQYPCVSIMGPRQCGKTTFAKSTFPNYEYIDLELPSDLAKLESDQSCFSVKNQTTDH